MKSSDINEHHSPFTIEVYDECYVRLPKYLRERLYLITLSPVLISDIEIAIDTKRLVEIYKGIAHPTFISLLMTLAQAREGDLTKQHEMFSTLTCMCQDVDPYIGSKKYHDWRISYDLTRLSRYDESL
jgi:hypothetical protein